jgi:hypothetical protein
MVAGLRLCYVYSFTAQPTSKVLLLPLLLLLLLLLFLLLLLLPGNARLLCRSMDHARTYSVVAADANTKLFSPSAVE